jgi:hypothetical protein
MRVMVAALASEEPETAPNNAEAASVATADRRESPTGSPAPPRKAADSLIPDATAHQNEAGRPKGVEGDVEERCRSRQRERAGPSNATIAGESDQTSAIQTGMRRNSSARMKIPACRPAMKSFREPLSAVAGNLVQRAEDGSAR